MKPNFSEPFNPGNLRPWSDWFLAVVLIGATLHFAGFMYVLCRDVDSRMDDFDAYYYRTRVHAEGGNPYDPGVLVVEGGKKISGKYLYPPMTLPMIGLTHQLSRHASALLFLGLKCVCLAVVIWLWVVYCNPARVDWRLLAIALFLAFGRCIAKDLDAGNIVIFEQLGIWLAVLCFLRGRWFLYAGLIVLVAVFKVTPLMLLGLCFLQKDRRAWMTAFAAAAIYLALFFSPLVHPSSMFNDFIALASSRDERGSVNPSSLAVLRDLAETMGSKSTGPLWTNPGTLLYGGFVLVVVGIALSVLVRRRWNLDRWDAAMLGIFVYALCAPRFKDYSYILMIMPALYVVWTCLRPDLLRLAALVMMCFHFYRYQQWSVMAVLFLVYAIYLWRESPRASKPFKSGAAGNFAQMIGAP